MSKAEILLVEDDQDLAEGLRDALALEGYSIRHVGDGPAALRDMRGSARDLIVLDAMLPNLSGFDVLKELRARGDETPVLMLTARSAEMDKVRGLKLGADDYVTKPFGIMELVARIEAILKRTRAAGSLTRLTAGEVVVDFRARKAWLRGAPVTLTRREFEILEVLARRRGQAVSRSELIARIWGTDDDVEVSTRTVDQHVLSLRRKLGDRSEAPQLIETVYGYGYRLA
ncbi:MAG: response regulator transcription factor [Vicinamibacteria bacterium]|nr:response regulator transcription factor [Vicinamibacteria bacterium]